MCFWSIASEAASVGSPTVIGPASIRLTACAQFESAEKIARCRTHELLHLPDGLFDSIDVILQDEAVMGTGDDRQVAGTRGYQAQ